MSGTLEGYLAAAACDCPSAIEQKAPGNKPQRGEWAIRTKTQPPSPYKAAESWDE